MQIFQMDLNCWGELWYNGKRLNAFILKLFSFWRGRAVFPPFQELHTVPKHPSSLASTWQKSVNDGTAAAPTFIPLAAPTGDGVSVLASSNDGYGDMTVALY